MIKIGLIGEDTNDTSSIRNLLEQKYKGRANFIALAKKETGYKLDNPKLLRVLKSETKHTDYRFLLYIRDLDALPTFRDKIKAKESWFNNLNSQLGKNGIFLLNIYELEALILADITTFNDHYNLNPKLKFPGDPMRKKEPKEYLMKATHKTNNPYKESHCPAIFQKLNFDTIKSKCAYFDKFIAEFDKKLAKR